MALSIEQYQSKIAVAKAARNTAATRVDSLKKTVGELEETRAAAEFLQVAIQNVAMATQEKFVLHIETIVNKVISAVFPDGYEFKLEFKISRGRSEAQLLFYKDGHVIDPMESSGGGLVDCASTALRLACWSLSNAPEIILLDECAKHLSLDLQPRFAQVLADIAKELQLQIPFVTHSEAIVSVADNVITIKQKEGKAFVS